MSPRVSDSFMCRASIQFSAYLSDCLSSYLSFVLSLCSIQLCSTLLYSTLLYSTRDVTQHDPTCRVLYSRLFLSVLVCSCLFLSILVCSCLFLSCLSSLHVYLSACLFIYRSVCLLPIYPWFCPSVFLLVYPQYLSLSLCGISFPLHLCLSLSLSLI